MQGGSGWDAAAGAHPVADTVTTIGTVLITLSLDALRTGLGARIIPAVLDGESMPLDLGRARRLFTPAQAQGPRPARRRRVRLPGCDRLGSWCDAHNLTHWADGGATDLSNGVLLCGWHHQVIHRGEWAVVLAADGHPDFIPPAWLDPARRPRRNTRHRPPGTR